MRDMKHLAVIVIALASLTACKKKKEESGSSSESSGKATTEKGGGGGPWGAWDMAGRKAAFEGAHVAPGGSAGRWEAWDVKGDKITVWDGTAEKTLELELLSPCEAKITEKSDGGSSSTTHHYTIQDGKIVSGLGSAGSKKGQEAVACISNTIVVLDAAGKCTEWSASMFDDGKYEQKPATCGWKKEGDKEVFAATVNGSETTLGVYGDALMTEQLASTHSEKVADFAAAKAARDAKK
jgi:hypothetical protein